MATPYRVGPSIWVAVSSPMFDIMRQDGFYALLLGAISLQQKQVAGFAFINDTDLCVTHHTNKAEHMVNKVQQAVTHWEGLLRATGGALVLEKCFWYLIDFVHSNNKWTYKTGNQAPGSLSILDTDHRQVHIQRLEPSEA